MKVGERIISGNNNYFKEIFDKYYPVMCVFANKLINDNELAKDLVQDVFIKILNVDIEFENEKALQAYLYVSTKNTCFTHLKKTKNISTVESAQVTIPSEKTVLNEILQQETYRLLEEAIKGLGEQSQKIIKLTLSGYTNKEAAKELNISINTVKTLKLRAYRILREKLGHQFVAILLTQFFDFFK